MELEHSFTVPVPLDRAWDVLLDVARVAPCMPGATLDSVDGDDIHGKVKVKVGPINMTYAGTARIVERDKATGMVRLEASGKETKGAGTASATVRSVLEDRGDETFVVVLTTLNVTGKPAQFGRGVLNEVSGKLLSIFAANLAEMLAHESDGGATELDTPGAPEADQPTPAVPAGTVGDLHLNARAVSALAKNGITTVAELAAKTDEELLAIDGIGRASVDEIKARLAEHQGAIAQPAVAAATATTAAAAPAPASQGTEPTSGAAKASANGAGTVTAAAPRTPRKTTRQRDESLNLLRVAGLPVLKRSIPVLAGVTAVLIISWRRKLRRRG